MASLSSRSPSGTGASPVAPAALVAVLGLLLLGGLVLLTPAFTDYEVEAEPAIRALLAGDVTEGLRLLPLYGGAVLLAFPCIALVDALGGGDLAVFRAAAVTGAAGMVVLAVVGARWLQAEGAGRRLQLAPAVLIGLSPCVALAWSFGHMEELVVGALAIGGLVLVARGGARSVAAGGVLVGLAVAGKASAIVVVPVAIACIATRRDLLRFLAASALAGAALLLPVVLPKVSQFSATITATGADRVSSRGNLWWFLGPRNPNYVDPSEAPVGSVRTLFTSDNSARLSPQFAADHAHELIVVLAALLAAAWWWRVGRSLAGADRRRLVASALLIASAVLWWRAVADPWFQAYYLTPALVAIVLADARLGRAPILGAFVFAALWLLHGQNAPDMGLNADATSALRLAWLLPTGLWLTTRAMRRPA